MRQDDSTTRGVADKTESSHNIARRAVASKHWRWMPGMLMRTQEGERECAYRLDGAESLYKESDILANEGRHHDEPDDPIDGRWPDLTDPATLGWLVALWREAWGPVDVFDFAARYIPPVAGAAGRVCDGSLILADPRSGAEIFKSVASSRAERFVAALEAAP